MKKKNPRHIIIKLFKTNKKEKIKKQPEKKCDIMQKKEKFDDKFLKYFYNQAYKSESMHIYFICFNLVEICSTWNIMYKIKYTIKSQLNI